MINLLWIIPTVLIVLYLLSVSGRAGHKGLDALQGNVFAHRGLHNDTRPENSLSAFKAAKEKGYGIELDLHLLKDGSLAVFHDHTLVRMTGKDGTVEDLTAKDLTQIHLNGTAETIPTFEEVLALFDGTVPLIVELKAAKNHGALVDAAVKALRGYRGAYCVESFDPRCLWHLRRWHPDIIRGQLSQNFMKSDEKLSGVTKFVLTHLLTNFLTRPDFVAYRFTDRKELSVTLARKLWGVQGVVWTLTDNEQHAKALKEGYLPI
ncbi:MAG: glycerophosphodiester phosphodiesterase, partial [Clostridia bacterium]|nr:glycerophosphodiester phosphodiesterase [Clostridia bacterium]